MPPREERGSGWQRKEGEQDATLLLVGEHSSPMDWRVAVRRVGRVRVRVRRMMLDFVGEGLFGVRGGGRAEDCSYRTRRL